MVATYRKIATIVYELYGLIEERRSK